jgi:hypothetical protein
MWLQPDAEAANRPIGSALQPDNLIKIGVSQPPKRGETGLLGQHLQFCRGDYSRLPLNLQRISERRQKSPDKIGEPTRPGLADVAK